jgi:CBS domain-containing protein
MPDTPHIVSDVMTYPVVAVRRDTRFKDIVRALAEGPVSAVPVVEADGRVVGVVPEADLLPKEEFRDRDLAHAEQLRSPSDLAKAGAVTAGEVMSVPAIMVAGTSPWPKRPGSWPWSTSSVCLWSTTWGGCGPSSAVATC